MWSVLCTFSLKMNLLWIALTSVVAAKEIIFNPDPVVALGTNSPIRFSVNLAAGVGAGNVALTSDDFDFTSCQLSFTNENAQHPQYVKAFFKSQQRKLQYEIKAYLFVPGQCKQPETLIVKLIDPNPMLCIIWADPHVQPILDKSAKLPPPVTEFVTSADAMTITPSDYWFSLAHDKPNGEKSFVVFETEKVMIQAKGRIYDDHVGTEPGGYWLTEVDACYEKTCFSYSIKAITKRIEQFHPPGGAPAGFSLKWEDRILHTPSDNYRGINAKDGADPNTPEDVLEKLDGGAFTLVFPDKTEMTVWSKINHKIIQQIEIKRPEGTGYDNVYRGICTVQRSGSSSDQKEYQAEYVSGDAEIAVAKGDYKRIDVPGYQQNCPVPSQPECETYPPPTTSKKPPPPDTQTYPHPPPATSSNPPPPDTQTYPHPPPATSSHPPPPPRVLQENRIQVLRVLTHLRRNQLTLFHRLLRPQATVIRPLLQLLVMKIHQ